MTTTSITFQIESDKLPHYTDAYLAQLWHIAQANPAPFGDAQACELAEQVGREIVRRWLATTPPELWHHQGRHASQSNILVPAEN
ncbi:hypothetical protein [Comamonas aquatica]|uniref:hypothetical protein n=1 Tax=Comamonas aquatica TaxID=225991 RepID=UPI00244C587F|nr:hypothetical protein [Comamonas aquatica]MDH1675842.1 hypothetical protein [Comamonas aquatica]MDH1679486.1 hypothetical protein [Comamonas aquatica]